MNIKKFCTFCGEPLTSILRKSLKRQFCGSCKKFVYENPMAAVAGIILYDSMILLARRAPGQTYENLWCIPCGHIEYDEDVRAALVREIKEETNLNIKPVSLYNVHSNFHNSEAHSVGIWFVCDIISGKLIAGDDVAELKFFAYNEIQSLAFPTDRFVIDQLYKEEKLRIKK